MGGGDRGRKTEKKKKIGHFSEGEVASFLLRK